METLRFASAHELFESFPMVVEDMQSLPDGESSLEFLTKLTQSDTPEEAVTFAAYLLPRRKAVWWGCQCVGGLSELLNDIDRHMLDLAEQWVRQPEEEQRLAAFAEGMAVRSKTPGVWIALAAGWSGGSLAPPDAQKVIPPPYLTARAVNTGILGALAQVDARHRADTLDRFVDRAVKLAVQ